MSTGKFLILAVLSVMIIVLVLVEVVSEAQVTGLADAISMHQSYVNQSLRQQEVLRQMLQRLAVASMTDPALADVLHSHGIHITRQSSPPAAPAPSAATPPPAPPDVPAVNQ
jgi:predicted Holliday junction resolvase-like endonuclease